LVVVLFGLLLLWRYANTPAQANEPEAKWPENSRISLDSHQPTLVMFVHPHCPCTRASLAELARIAAQCKGRFIGWVVFFKPNDAEANWEHSELMRDAEQIPGVQIAVDSDAELARRFEATTSGQALLYSPTGQLLFGGGITASRGHAGDNNGESAIIALLRGESLETARTPVFGCPIIESQPLK
jgi:hypothetical protein